MLELLQAYVFGFLSSLTPCVFPLIPITISLFGARETQSKLRGFLLGVSYVLGIAVTYTVLGMVSAKLGFVFGSFLGDPWVISAICLFLFLLTLNTLDLLEFSFLSKLQTKASAVGGKGFTGAFLMGTASGLVAAPCIGPALVIILTKAAQSQSITWGASLLFSYSIGLGTIFIFLATFSNLIGKLPKSGNWLNGVKFLLATLLVLVIFSLTEKYLTPLLELYNKNNAPALLLAANNFGILLAWYSYRSGKKLIRLVASFLIALSIYQFAVYTPHVEVTEASNKSVKWLNDFDTAVKLSKLEKKVLIVDLYADWCTACKEFEHITFVDPGVIAKLSTYITARIDFTDTSTEIAQKLTERYNVPGLPVILLLKPDGSGEELPDSRIAGYLGPEPFLAHLNKHLK